MSFCTRFFGSIWAFYSIFTVPGPRGALPGTARTRETVTLVVNARFLTQPIVGVQRYAVEISKRLKVLRPDTRFLTPKGVVHEALAEQLGAEVTGPALRARLGTARATRLAYGAPLLSLCNTGADLSPAASRHAP